MEGEQRAGRIRSLPVETRQASVDIPEVRFSPGERVKSFLLGVTATGAGAFSSLVATPAFVVRGIQLQEFSMGAIGVFLFLLPGAMLIHSGVTSLRQALCGHAYPGSVEDLFVS